MHVGNDSQDSGVEWCFGMFRRSLLLKGFSVLLVGRPGERSRQRVPRELPSFRDLSHD
jgi:hypothetical protein